MIQNYNDSASTANENKWAMEDFGGETDSTYPTQFGFFNTGGSGQIGDYSNPTGRLADQRLRHRHRPGRGHRRGVVLHDERAGAVAAGAATTSGPGRRTSRRPTPQAFENLTQYDNTPQFWYLTK